ncbi:MAG: M56 family metallopeptidase, partial [Vicinamibacterales bacterium]
MTTAFANVVAVSAHWLVVVAVGAAALGLLRVHAAAARLAVFRAMVIVALALPLVPIPYQPSREPTPIAPVRPSGVASPSGGVVSPSTHTISVDATREAVQQGTLSVLAAGALLRLLWLAEGLLRLRRWQAAGEPTDDAALRQATQLLGVAAEFRSSQDVDGPVTFGWRRPIVLLPRSVRLLSDAERTAIACHELVHVARHHWLETLLVEALRSVSWFHPATWWWHDQWRLARERTVDRAAVELLRDRRIYVDALLSLATVSPHRAAPAVAMFARRPQLVR